MTTMTTLEETTMPGRAVAACVSPRRVVLIGQYGSNNYGSASNNNDQQQSGKKKVRRRRACAC